MSYAESITKFMAWAEEKIAQAVAEDEAFEAKTGTRNFISEEENFCPKRMTSEEKMYYVQRYLILRGQGIPAKKAGKMTGAHPSTLNKWKREFQAKGELL
jgi:hypothetical protein|tara:strand:+ start:207 stop:506 length:300 start_codon:yes stop_codon:yes gene_type:complete